MTTPLLTDADLANLIGDGTSAATVAEWRRRYDWPHVRLGRKVRYTETNVEQILRMQAEGGKRRQLTPGVLPGQTKRSAAKRRSA